MNIRKRLAILCPLVAMLVACSSASALTISPLPGTPTASRFTQISFLGAAPGSLSRISVVGSRSGRHRGHLHAYQSQAGASLLLSKPFLPNEKVVVRATLTVGSRHRTVGTHFTIAAEVAPLNGSFPVTPGTPNDIQSFQSEPALHPPRVTVHQTPQPGSVPGMLFSAPFLGPGQWGPMIFDNAGNLLWFHPVPAEQDAADFRTQLYEGKNVLTWWQGRTIILGYGIGTDVIADANYRTVAVVKAGNGLSADEHEFTLLPNGSALIMAYDPVRQSLAGVGGPSAGIAVDGALQLIDIRTGLVMWEWRSIGHVALADSYSKPPTSPTGYFDYIHLNSAQMLDGGNLVVSARNTWGIYEIEGRTGRVLWQLGGKRSSFALGPGVAFAYQHNAVLMPGGRLSLFDDEGAPPVRPPSRGEIVALDFKRKTATLQSQFVRTPPVATGSQGNSQALASGGWLVGWGGLPNLTEFDSQGQIVYDAQLPSGENSYRTYRETWTGQPLTPPALVVKQGGIVHPCPPGALCPDLIQQIAYASWNGATTVSSWQLLAGESPSALAVVGSVPRSGFETSIPAPPHAFYQVRALSAGGHVLGTSTVVRSSG